MANNKLQPRSVKRQKAIMDTIVHIFLAIMCVIWLLPLFYIIMHSFRAEKCQFVTTFLPETYTFDNYIKLMKDANVWQSLWHTFKDAIVVVPFSSAIALVLAVFLNREMKGRSVYRTIFFLPMVR